MQLAKHLYNLDHYKYVSVFSFQNSFVHIHTATYNGEIEAVAQVYIDKINASSIFVQLIANPEGMLSNHRDVIKGADSALLDYIIHQHKELLIKKICVNSINDHYYIKRGWKNSRYFKIKNRLMMISSFYACCII